MPGRPHPLLTNQIYHVYNKTINRNKLFIDDFNCGQFMTDIWYYRSSASVIRLSNLNKLNDEYKKVYLEKIENDNLFRVSILTYVLMPTHYHFILKQKQDKGISSFISLIQNSFTRFYNIKNNLNGPIFVHRFKSKLIVSEEQLKHTSRYIHLNPYTSNIVKDLKSLIRYPWSSLKSFIYSSKDSLTEIKDILSLFNHNKGNYKKFIFDRADYQKTLEICKYAEKQLYTSEV